MTPGGKLRIQSGRFRAYVENTIGTGFHPIPEGELLAFDGEALFEAIKILHPFIGNDASRPWTNGILLNGQSAFATNNTCIIEYWLGNPFPRQINIPRAAIREMLRVDIAPTHGQLATNSITFHYPNGCWIRTQLLATEWPFETIDKILNRDNRPLPVPVELWPAITKLNQLSDGSNRIYIDHGLLTTHTEEEVGGSVEVDGLEFKGCYNIAMLSLLEGVVTHADFTLYPAPALFFGKRLRGAIAGIRSHFEQ